MRSGDWSRAFYIVYGVNPGARISQKLYTLRKPAHVEFNGWDEFHAHLDSLEALLPTLREIDSRGFRLVTAHFIPFGGFSAFRQSTASGKLHTLFIPRIPSCRTATPATTNRLPNRHRLTLFQTLFQSYPSR